MADKLAKLDDLKFAVKAGTAGIDNELTGLLIDASAMFEREVGASPGGLVRRVDRLAYPDKRGHDARYGVRVIHLDARPIESVSQVVQLFATSTPAEFDAAASSGVGLLAADVDYFVDSSDMARLSRVDAFWSASPRHIRVTYTAGWADPDDTDAIADGGVVAPAHVQRAVIAQATLLFNTRKTAGLGSVKGSSKAGAVNVEKADIHPLLKVAAAGYRRLIP